jgi:hypothetical protein
MLSMKKLISLIKKSNSESISEDISQRGAIIAEAAVAFPFMAFFMISLVDFSLLLDTYFKANTTLRETLRYATTIPNLTKSPATWPGEDLTYPNSGPPSDGSYDSSITNPLDIGFAATGNAHRDLHERVKNQIVPALGMNLKNDNLQILSRCFPKTNEAAGRTEPNPEYPQIRVSVIGRYNSIFGNVSALGLLGADDLKFTLTGNTKYVYDDCL